MLTLRRETPEDIPAIRYVHTVAFGRANEADLVERLRDHDALTLSLVAVQDGQIVGHIAFSLVTITSNASTMEALGLAPMAVLPAYQRQGIGSQLVEAALQLCRHTPYGVVVVLGHPHYYPRFGFAPARPWGIVCEYDVPDEVFMVKEIHSGALAQTHGVVRYRSEFAMA
jgi:putative acetyltransferase